MTLLNPCIRATGPLDAKIALVGEAPGESEELAGVPFVGAAGQELNSMLREAGIDRKDCYFTNVLFTRPPSNKLEAFLVKKGELPPGYPLRPLKQGGYLHPDFLPEISRLGSELEQVQPNLVVALGGTAAWALLGTGGISSIRGTVAESTLVSGLKVLPTFHPAAILRAWNNRVVVVADLLKAERERHFPEIRRPERRVTIDPSFFELQAFAREAEASALLVCDIETAKGQITCIGFATSPARGFVVPFWDKRKDGWSYWAPEEEPAVWALCAQILQHPCVIFQNGLYDVQYLWRAGIPVPGFLNDTMLLHHSLYPEQPKGLAFMASILTNEASWKLTLRQRHGSEETKRDE